MKGFSRGSARVLHASPLLAPIHGRVADADCVVSPEWTFAKLFAPLTEDMLSEIAGLYTHTHTHTPTHTHTHPPTHTPTHTHTHTHTHTGDSRQERVARYALELSHVNNPDATQTFDLLISMLRQIQLDPTTPKWKQIKVTNRRFARVIGCHPSALQFLGAIGFERKQKGDGVGGTKAECLVLERDDPGLLWLGISVLEQHRRAIG